ncbi:MAG: hypothetical protein E6G13_10205 [Actinobacteria bacterium]|nr:MAG: hypothetical protein E6G13_10205 [Actinomycetota bacterium]
MRQTAGEPSVDVRDRDPFRRASNQTALFDRLRLAPTWGLCIAIVITLIVGGLLILRAFYGLFSGIPQ